MNYLSINHCDQSNGPGLRVSVFVSGCSLHCKGCFNPESWDPKAGKRLGEWELLEIINTLNQKHISGLSILGGDPLEPCNIDDVVSLCKLVKINSDKSIWLWTGHRLSKYINHEILHYVDVVVDGPFIEAQKVTEQGVWFGSKNQRILLVSEKAKDWWMHEGLKYWQMSENVLGVYDI